MTSQANRNKSRSLRIASDMPDEEPINFDLDRMKKAVDGPFRRMPEGLTREQFRDWMLNTEGEPQDA